jgi:hypothetical protein
MWSSGPAGWFRIEIWKQMAVRWTTLYSRTDVDLKQANINTVK